MADSDFFDGIENQFKHHGHYQYIDDENIKSEKINKKFFGKP